MDRSGLQRTRSQTRRSSSMRAQARTIPRSKHLQQIVRHRVGYPHRRKQSLRWRLDDTRHSISASRRFQSRTNSWRRTRTVLAAAPKRLENPSLRCRNDPARRANDEFRSVVEAGSKSGSRLCRRFLDARQRTRAPLGQRNPQHLVLELSLASASLGNDMADKKLEPVTIEWLPLSNLSHL